MSRKQWELRAVAMADRAFANHVVAPWGVDEPDRWYMSRPGTTVYSCEIAHLLRSRVLVHGDIQAVLFAPTSPLLPRAAVSYIAGSHLDYISGKVVTGERWQWHPEVAAADVQLELLDDRGDGLSPLERNILSELSLRLLSGESFTKESFSEELSQLGSHEWTFGRVVNSDIIWAWRAVVKLDNLLAEKPGA